MSEKTFYTVFNDLVELTNKGSDKLLIELTKLDSFQQAINEMDAGEEKEKQQKELDALRVKISERIKFVAFHCAKIQKQVHFLAFNCLDDSIPQSAIAAIVDPDLETVR